MCSIPCGSNTTECTNMMLAPERPLRHREPFETAILVHVRGRSYVAYERAVSGVIFFIGVQTRPVSAVNDISMLRRSQGFRGLPHRITRDGQPKVLVWYFHFAKRSNRFQPFGLLMSIIVCVRDFWNIIRRHARMTLTGINHTAVSGCDSNFNFFFSSTQINPFEIINYT